jgi:hypothetical protein
MGTARLSPFEVAIPGAWREPTAPPVTAVRELYATGTDVMRRDGPVGHPLCISECLSMTNHV